MTQVLDPLWLSPCRWCGGDGPEIAEAWSLDYAEVMFDACCEAMLTHAHALVEDGYLSGLLNALDWPGLVCTTQVRVTHDAFGTAPLIDYRLEVRPIPIAEAKAFVGLHHRHSKRPAGARFALGAFNGRRLIAVALAGRPVARMTDATTVLEVNRLCAFEGPLARNACSMLYSACAREGRRRGFTKIQTFIRESELGTTLAAAGWAREAVTRGGSWSRDSRPRTSTNIGRKVRYARRLDPAWRRA